MSQTSTEGLDHALIFGLSGSGMAPTHGLGLDRSSTKKHLISLILVSYGIYVIVIFELYIWVGLRPTV